MGTCDVGSALQSLEPQEHEGPFPRFVSECVHLFSCRETAWRTHATVVRQTQTFVKSDSQKDDVRQAVPVHQGSFCLQR